MNLEEKRLYVQKNLEYLPKEEYESFEFNFACVFTKNSVGMEKGVLAHLEEVVSVIRGRNVKLDETMKRALYNHYHAYLMLKDYATKYNELDFSEEFLKDLHAVVVKDIIDTGGCYRGVNIKINGSKHVPCDHIKVYDKMKRYFNNLATMEDNLDKACYAHLELAKIHPFLDGNGRLCRLILNYELLELGYLPIIIPSKRREEYFDTLEAYKVEKTMEPFKNLLIDLLNKEYDRLIELIQPYAENK